MTKLATLFENSTRLSLTTAEEAQRFGHPAVDVEHVFLALALSETTAGRRLRQAGVHIAAARDAVQAQHAERLAGMGIHDVPVPPAQMPTQGGGHVEWNERALDVFSRYGGDGHGLVLLGELIDDPGGFVAAVVRRLDVDPDALLRGAEDPTGSPAAPGQLQTTERGWWQVAYAAFIPAPVETVWALLEDAVRRPEWDTALASIRADGPAGASRWIGQARPYPSGRSRWRVPRRARTQIIERIGRDEPHQIEWHITYPGLNEAYSRRLRIILDEQPGGTRIHLRLQGKRPHVLANVRIRVRRFIAAGELTGFASGISRAFRS